MTAAILKADYIKLKENSFSYNGKPVTPDFDVVIDGKVIWLDIEENKLLRELHNRINFVLKNKFNIGLSEFDGESFKFHSTLFQENEFNENINKIGLILKEKIKIPQLLHIRRLYFGISEVGRVGTYKVIYNIELKTC